MGEHSPTNAYDLDAAKSPHGRDRTNLHQPTKAEHLALWNQHLAQNGIRPHHIGEPASTEMDPSCPQLDTSTEYVTTLFTPSDT